MNKYAPAIVIVSAGCSDGGVSVIFEIETVTDVKVGRLDLGHERSLRAHVHAGNRKVCRLRSSTMVIFVTNRPRRGQPLPELFDPQAL